ncbi:MAG: rRNA maturation RNase YbeY [Patescibacteria group bacterium]
MKAELDIRNFTKGKTPSFPYEKALKAVLPSWELSLVFAGRVRARSLNKRLRNKEYVPNVLSYESGKKSGEIIICPEVARSQARSYGFSYTAMVGFLFIHGLLHLKGMSHSATMDKQERALLQRFINLVPPDGKAYHDRH